MRRAGWRLGLAGALLASLLPAQAQDVTWQVGSSFSISSGDYGEDGDTDLFYWPVTVKRYLPRGDVTLTLPYVDIDTEGNVAVTAGEVVSVEGAETQSESGLGDIILKGRYYAVEQHDYWPFIDVVAKIKFPTADEDKGLGTGEADVSLIGEFSRRINAQLFTLGELGYTWIGDPPEGDLDNRLLYSAGVGYSLSDQLTVSGYLDGRTALIDSNDDPLSLQLLAEFKYRPELRFDTMLEFGLNDGSPDYGVTFGVRYRM